jgi:hypothetical protein
MEVLFQREDGRRATAVILAAHRRTLRVVSPGLAETAEWTRTDGEWRDELGRRIEIEALLSSDVADCSQFCAGIWPLAMAAGRPLD